MTRMLCEPSGCFKPGLEWPGLNRLRLPRDGPLVVRMAARRLIGECGRGILVEGITRTGAGRARHRIQALLDRFEAAAPHSGGVGQAILAGNSRRRRGDESKDTHADPRRDKLKDQFHSSFLSRETMRLIGNQLNRIVYIVKSSLTPTNLMFASHELGEGLSSSGELSFDDLGRSSPTHGNSLGEKS